MKKKLYWMIGILLVIILGIILIFFTQKKKSNEQFPMLTLKGDKIITVKIGTDYQEPGFEAIDKLDGNITSKVKIENTINPETPGTYEIIYSVTNSRNITIKEKRFVKLILPEAPTYKSSYDNIDNSFQAWGTNNKKNHERSIYKEEESLKKYHAYLQGPDEKVIYLTFDEGTNETYLGKIVDVLNENNVKATFFLCKGFIVHNPELMKILVETGHSVGNHTANHKHMPTLATKVNFEKYVNEITSVEKAFYEITGKEMDKVYREPKGEWSYRSLQIMKDMGYKTYFWSASYVDFNGTLSKETALSYMKERYYNGVIYLMHPTNKGNYDAIDDFIKYMKDLGYRFDLVKNIPE